LYTVETDEQSDQQIAVLPTAALPAFLEARTLLEVHPWSGNPTYCGNPEGPVRTLAFGHSGMITYLVTEDLRRVDVLWGGVSRRRSAPPWGLAAEVSRPRFVCPPSAFSREVAHGASARRIPAPLRLCRLRPSQGPRYLTTCEEDEDEIILGRGVPVEGRLRMGVAELRGWLTAIAA
jgi:hypothetical protein